MHTHLCMHMITAPSIQAQHSSALRSPTIQTEARWAHLLRLSRMR